MSIKEGLLYSQDHEWVRVEGGKAYIGITDHAQAALGDIVFVEMPAVDSAIEIGAQAGVLESIKAVAELYCPASGTVLEINEALEGAPELLNSDPYGQHIFVMTLDAQADDLMDAASYAEYLKTLD